MQDFTAAFESMKQALAKGLTPTYECYAHCQMAHTFIRRGELAAAVEAYLRCLSVQPKTASAIWEAAVRMAVIYDEAGRSNEASSLKSLANKANQRGLCLDFSYEQELRSLVRRGNPVQTDAGYGSSPTPDVKPAAGAINCPACGHGFTPPRITLATQAVIARYGPNPVQCPKCRHIWSH